MKRCHCIRLSGLLHSWLLLPLLWAAFAPAILDANGLPQQEQSGNQSTAKSGQQPDADKQKLDLTEQVVQDVLEPLQSGMEARDPGQVLSVFDSSAMPDRASFGDNLTAFLRRQEAIRFRYEVLQVTSEGDHGFATADVDLAATPDGNSETPVQRSTQMRFQLRLTQQGWKIVAVRPADFFYR